MALLEQLTESLTNKKRTQTNNLIHHTATILEKELKLRVSGKDLKPEVRKFLESDELYETIYSCVSFTLKDEILSDGDLHCSDLKNFLHHKNNSYETLCKKLTEGSLHQFSGTGNYNTEMLQCLFTLYGDIICSKQLKNNEI